MLQHARRQFSSSQRPAARQLAFFFSSRRRHTRCLSDWSSDVCSSDLRQTFSQIFSSFCPQTLQMQSTPRSTLLLSTSIRQRRSFRNRILISRRKRPLSERSFAYRSKKDRKSVV